MTLNITVELQESFAANTRRAYSRWIRSFLAATYKVPEARFALDHMREEIVVTALQPQYLRSWLESLKDEKYSQASLNQARTAMVWLAGWLVAKRSVPVTVQGNFMVVHSPRAEAEQPQRRAWLNLTQAQKLLEALSYEERPAVRARNTALLTLMITCGLRREEAAAARWGDVEYDLSPTDQAVTAAAPEDGKVARYLPARANVDSPDYDDDTPSSKALVVRAALGLDTPCALQRVEEAEGAEKGEESGAAVRARILVRGKGGKGRSVELPPLVIHALLAWRIYHPMPYGQHFIFTIIKPDGEVTDVPLSGEQILYIVKSIGQQVGLSITPHDLRRTFARGAFEAGADYDAIRQALGHNSAGTTQMYVGADTQRDEASAAQTWAEALQEKK